MKCSPLTAFLVHALAEPPLLTQVKARVFLKVDVGRSPPNIEIAVDANRDGTIEFGDQSPDKTSDTQRFRFWCNSDTDKGGVVDGNDWEEDDYEKGNPDYQDGVITCRRDLEDFVRLWIKTEENLQQEDEVVLSWEDVTEGSPAINVYPAAETTDGGTKYLTDETVKQIALGQNNGIYTSPVYSKSVGTASTTQSLTLPSSWAWDKDKPRYLLFEGVGRGKGTLKVAIKRGDTKVAESKVYMDLKDIKEMYERWTVGDGNGTAPASQATLSTDRLPNGVGVFSYSATSPETNDYIMFVHGWNMASWEKDRYAETAYKRLYWQGYKGRFGAFQWPTTYGFDATVWQLIVDNDNYDNGEMTAWRAAAPLKQLLINLNGFFNGAYAGKIRVIAHSMGNVVTGEALRLAAQQGTGQIVNTYVASQAAVPGHCYDVNAPEFAFTPETPNIYKNWLSGNSTAVGSRVNFFNENDYALVDSRWGFDQQLKPADAVTRSDGSTPGRAYTYRYKGLPGDDPSQDLFEKYWVIDQGQQGPPIEEVVRLGFGNAENVDGRYEIMAFAAEARSRALGRMIADVSGFDGKQDLGSIWPADLQEPDPNKRYSAHKWHSAQFRSTNMKQKGYWDELLRTFDVPYTPLQ